MKTTTEKYIFIAGGVLFAVLIAVALLVKQPDNSSVFRDLDKIIRYGKLRVVSENSNIGINRDEDGISGFQYEILKIFADSLGVELEIAMENDLKRCIDELNAGQHDIIAKYTPTTVEWQDTVSFTKPLLYSRQMLVQPIDPDTGRGRISHPYELAGDSVCIPQNSPHRMRLRHLSDEIADTIYIIEVENTTPEELATWVAEGKIRHTICHEQLTRKLRREYKNIDTSVPVSLIQPYSWMVSKRSETLLEKLDHFLCHFIGSNAYWNLYRKYY